MFAVINALFAAIGSLVRALHNVFIAAEIISETTPVMAKGILNETLDEYGITDKDNQALIAEMAGRKPRKFISPVKE